MRRNYSNTAVATTLAAGITDSDVSLTVADATGYPDPPFTITIESEVILVGAKNGTTFSSLTRGYDGTTAAAHDAGAGVEHTVVAEDVERALAAYPMLPGYWYGAPHFNQNTRQIPNDNQEAAAMVVPVRSALNKIACSISTGGSADGVAKLCLWDEAGKLLHTWTVVATTAAGSVVVEISGVTLRPGGYLIGVHVTGFATPPTWRTMGDRAAVLGPADPSGWMMGGYSQASVSSPSDFTGTSTTNIPPRIYIQITPL